MGNGPIVTHEMIQNTLLNDVEQIENLFSVHGEHKRFWRETYTTEQQQKVTKFTLSSYVYFFNKYGQSYIFVVSLTM